MSWWEGGRRGGNRSRQALWSAKDINLLKLVFSAAGHKKKDFFFFFLRPGNWLVYVEVVRKNNEDALLSLFSFFS